MTPATHVPQGVPSRASYKRGCRCLECKAANATYEAERRRRAHEEQLVDAKPAELKLFAMRAEGIGYRQAAKLTGLSESTVLDIRQGRTPFITRRTAQLILECRFSLAHGQVVTGWRTRRLLDSLQRDGFTKREIARRLGAHSPELQLNLKRCRVRTALRVRALHARINAEDLPDGAAKRRVS